MGPEVTSDLPPHTHVYILVKSQGISREASEVDAHSQGGNRGRELKVKPVAPAWQT